MPSDGTRTGELDAATSARFLHGGPHGLPRPASAERLPRPVPRRGTVLTLTALPTALLVATVAAPRVASADDGPAPSATLVSPSASADRSAHARETRLDRNSGHTAQPGGPGPGSRISPSPPDDRAPATRPSPLTPGPEWILTSRRIVLHDSVFNGVVTLETTAGPERILRFTARTVDISDLDLATRRGGVTWHLLAASGTTSTVAGAPMTLYAEELSGTVTGLGDGPHPPARTVTITPDAIPQWLRNPVDQPSGTGIRTLVLEDVTLSRTRLVDGDLTIPGLHLREVRS